MLLLHQRKDTESTLQVVTENTVFGRIVSLEQLISLFDVNRAEGELTRLSTLGNTLEKLLRCAECNALPHARTQVRS